MKTTDRTPSTKKPQRSNPKPAKHTYRVQLDPESAGLFDKMAVKYGVSAERLIAGAAALQAHINEPADGMPDEEVRLWIIEYAAEVVNAMKGAKA